MCDELKERMYRKFVSLFKNNSYFCADKDVNTKEIKTKVNLKQLLEFLSLFSNAACDRCLLYTPACRPRRS